MVGEEERLVVGEVGGGLRETCLGEARGEARGEAARGEVARGEVLREGGDVEREGGDVEREGEEEEEGVGEADRSWRGGREGTGGGGFLFFNSPRRLSASST